PSVATGRVHPARLPTVTSASIGDYFSSLIDGLNTSAAFYGRVFVQASGAGYQFGLQFKSKSTGTCTVYKSTVYSFGTTHLVVVKYTIVSGTVNDQVALFVDPAVSGSEPAADVTLTDPGALGCSGSPTTTDFDAPTGIDGVAIRQGSTTPAEKLDGIRVADN